MKEMREISTAISFISLISLISFSTMAELGIVITLVAISGGIALHLREARRRGACSLQPTMKPLQVSCLAAQVLGVQFYGRDAGQWFNAPFAVACILIGVAGLGALSIFCACRNEELSKE